MDWLQVEVGHPTSLSAPPESTRRFDWRMKANSRAARPAGVEFPKYERLQYIRRIQPPQVDTQMGEPFYEEIQAYRQRQVEFVFAFVWRFTSMSSFFALLDAEQAEDEAVLKERLSSWTLARLQEEGYCLTGLSAYWLEATQFGRPVASFLLGPGLTLPDHHFECVCNLYPKRS